MRGESAADQVCVERDELLSEVPDGRKVAGGSGVFEIVAGRWAEDGGRVGDETGEKRKREELTQRATEAQRAQRREGKFKTRTLKTEGCGTRSEVAPRITAIWSNRPVQNQR